MITSDPIGGNYMERGDEGGIITMLNALPISALDLLRVPGTRQGHGLIMKRFTWTLMLNYRFLVNANAHTKRVVYCNN